MDSLTATPPWTVALEAKPTAAIRRAVMRPLRKHNIAQAGGGGFTQVAITVRDAGAKIVGGLSGHAWHGWLFVELLALGPARGAGLGRRVMMMAEAEARRLGCTGIWLDTFTFQAPGFYQKLGFVEAGRIADHPAGHDRIFLVKRLQGEAVPLTERPRT